MLRIRVPLSYAGGVPAPSTIIYYNTGSGVTARANSTVYALGARMVIAQGDTSTNYLTNRKIVWECIVAGTSGAAVPAWLPDPTPDSTMLTDGTVTWIARRPGYSVGNTVNWTFATIYFLYALAAVRAAGDQIRVHYTSQENLTAGIQYGLPAVNMSVISVNKDSADAPTPMDVNGWIGSNGTARQVRLNPNGNATYYFYGITLRPNGNADSGFGASALEGAGYFESCYFYTVGDQGFICGGSQESSSYVSFTNCTFRFNGTGDGICCRASEIYLEGCTISTLGARPSTLFKYDSGGLVTTGNTNAIGCDFSYITGTLIANFNEGGRTFYISQCKLGAGVTILATQTSTNKSSAIAYVTDSASGDTHTFFGYYDAFGSCVSDTGIYYTSGLSGQSWKIVTTANCNFYYPFEGPFVDYYNTGTTSITPYFEILRDGSSTAFQNDEVWAEFWIKATASSTQTTQYTDRMALLGTPADQANGAGTSFWTGEQVTAWSGKIDSGTSVVPTEVGAIRGRVVVAIPSTTLYIDPQIRI